MYFFSKNVKAGRLLKMIFENIKNEKKSPEEKFEVIQNKIESLDFMNFNSTNLTILEKLYIVLCRVKHYDVFNIFNQVEVSFSKNGQKSSEFSGTIFKLNKEFGHIFTCKESKSSESEDQFDEVIPEENDPNNKKPSSKKLIWNNGLVSMEEIMLKQNINSEMLIVWRIYYQRFYNKWLTFESQKYKSSSKKYIPTFVVGALSFIESYMEIIEKDNLRNLEVFKIVLEYILCMLNIVTCYMIKRKSSSQIYLDSDIMISKNLKIMSSFMKLYKKIDSSTSGKISDLIKMTNEGVDHTQQVIFETCHPINRGESIKFNTLSYPNAIGTLVQLDKRCMSDINRDFFTLTSWDSQNESYHGKTEHNLNTNNVAKTNIGISFKISGNLKKEEIFLMVGDNTKASFEASHKSMDNNMSLNRWGYRARAIPICGYESYHQIASEKSHVAINIRQFSCLLVQILNRLSVTLINEIEPFLNGKRQNIEEKRLKNYLNWSIIKNGLNSIKKHQFLEEEKGVLQLSQKMKASISKSLARNSEEVSSKVSAEETDVMSGKSKNELETELLNDHNLTFLLNKLQSEEDFLHEIIGTVKGLQQPPHLLRSEKMRPTFTKEYQKKWENSENLIILSMLHHSELLKLLLASYDKNKKPGTILSYQNIKEQFSQICQKKNDLLNKMVINLQIEREFNQVCENVIEILTREINKQREEEEILRKEEEAKESLEKESQVKELTSLETLQSKMSELKKKYGNKKTGRRTDHIEKYKQSKEKDKKGKKDKKDKNKGKPVTDEPVMTEMKLKDEEKTVEPIVEKYFYEDMFNKTEVSDE